MRRSQGIAILAIVLAGLLGSSRDARATAITNKYTNAGLIGVTITNVGYVGSAWRTPGQPSCEYPLHSNVEHMFAGGIWVGAVNAAGERHVSTGYQDASTAAAGDLLREFDAFADADTLHRMTEWSNRVNDPLYDVRALATQQYNCYFNDYTQSETGNHTPLGVEVDMRTFAWGNPYADDFIIIDYAVINVSKTELRDVYLGFWADLTVGNTQLNDPYDSQAASRWNYYDDVNSAFGAAGMVPDKYTVDGDPNIWMAIDHDADGDEGLATSWVGYRLLGTTPAPTVPDGERPVSYNAWGFRHLPAEDDWYYENGDSTTPLLPGKYQIMGNRDFDVGQTQDTDFTIPSDWISTTCTGPFPTLADGDTIHISFAIVCGADSLSLLNNSKAAQVAYDDGFRIPQGPPSPILKVDYAQDSVILHWTPGDSLDATGHDLPSDSPLRSPEHHISTVTGRPDFEGYRIYRYQGNAIPEDPYNVAELVAQYDRIDGVGFDTGLPPLNDQGEREFVDTGLLDGFPYWYSVVCFAAPDVVAGLPELQSGFNENAQLVYPGPGPVEEGGAGVGVYPNPYRAGSMYDDRLEGELGRKLWFTNLPARCSIKIFTVAGDLVKTLHHDDDASGQQAWDVLTENNRPVASGLYIYVVENLDTGDVQRGKLVIIK